MTQNQEQTIRSLSTSLKFIAIESGDESLDDCEEADQTTSTTQNVVFNAEHHSDTLSFNSDIQIPIVGYEIMEERAKCTVYKLRVEDKTSSSFWYVYRRYTDFVRLCNKFRLRFPEIAKYLPRKRWLRSNFDSIFLERRANDLQTFIDAILREPDLLYESDIQDFFCLNEPPTYLENNQETKPIFEAYEDTICSLKEEIRKRDKVIEGLQDKLNSIRTEVNDNLSS